MENLATMWHRLQHTKLSLSDNHFKLSMKEQTGPKETQPTNTNMSPKWLEPGEDAAVNTYKSNRPTTIVHGCASSNYYSSVIFLFVRHLTPHAECRWSNIKAFFWFIYVVCFCLPWEQLNDIRKQNYFEVLHGYHVLSLSHKFFWDWTHLLRQITTQKDFKQQSVTAK